MDDIWLHPDMEKVGAEEKETNLSNIKGATVVVGMGGYIGFGTAAAFASDPKTAAANPITAKIACVGYPIVLPVLGAVSAAVVLEKCKHDLNKTIPFFSRSMKRPQTFAPAGASKQAQPSEVFEVKDVKGSSLQHNKVEESKKSIKLKRSVSMPCLFKTKTKALPREEAEFRDALFELMDVNGFQKAKKSIDDAREWLRAVIKAGSKQLNFLSQADENRVKRRP